MTELNRRDLLSSAAGLASFVALGGCESLKQAIENRPQRRDISTMGAGDPTLQIFKDAVAAMKALPASDPRNWTRQAEIHQNFCPHGNWFFLPWHRAYLLSFERICRTLTGQPSFGLPYWNWSCQRRIPAPFWDTASALFHTPRQATATSEANDSIVGAAAMQTILGETDFELFASGAATCLRGCGGFYGGIEGGPHNYIHGTFIRGTMASFMSPLDPVFWTHHNILDYFWYEWNQRGNPNTNASSYTSLSISGQMVDGAGNPIDYQVGSLVLAPLLSYRFIPPGVCGGLKFQALDRIWLRRFLEEGAALRFEPRGAAPAARGLSVAIGRPLSARIDLPQDVAAKTADAASAERLLLNIDGVRPPADEDFFIQVYVNLRPGEAPSTDSPAYSGSFAFFTDDAAHQHGAYNTYVDVDRALTALRAAGRYRPGDQVTATLIAVPVDGESRRRGETVDIGALSAVTIPRRTPPKATDKSVTRGDENR